MSRQAILDEKIKKFLAVRLDARAAFMAVWMLFDLHGGVLTQLQHFFFCLHWICSFLHFVCSFANKKSSKVIVLSNVFFGGR